MAATQVSKSERKREAQCITVPFVWEEKPGIPKKDWKPTGQQITHTLLPVKLVVSIPFGWEEKPGTPLRSFVEPGKKGLELECNEKRSSIVSVPATCFKDRGVDQGEDEGDDINSVHTDDSYDSAQSLLASAMSTPGQVPQHHTPLAPANNGTGEEKTPFSGICGVDGVTSSYEMETTNLAGASFLEWLFPLLVSNSSLLDKARCQQKDNPPQIYRNCSQVQRPLLTLGELIVMSRRRSCQRRVKNLPSKDVMRRATLPLGCGIFSKGSSISELPMKWRRHLQLKLL